MSNEKLLSVIIPVYNTAPYLERCIGSIRKQSYQALEIICVDNNSTDNSLEVLKHFAAEDPRILVLEQPKQGVSAARNMGIQNARGTYITFVDSDDAIDPDMYRTLVEVLEEDQTDISHCGYRRYATDGTVTDIMGTEEHLVETRWEAINHLLRGEKYTGSLCNKIYKSSLFTELKMDESIGHNEDVLLNFQLFNAAEKTTFLDKPFYWYYIRKESATSSSNNVVRRNNTLYVSEKVWELFKETPAKEAAANKYYYDLICSYRAGVFEKKKASDEEQTKIKTNAKALESSGCPLSRRNKMDFKLMKAMPGAYRICYSVYDKIRKPNWDVK